MPETRFEAYRGAGRSRMLLDKAIGDTYAYKELRRQDQPHGGWDDGLSWNAAARPRREALYSAEKPSLMADVLGCLADQQEVASMNADLTGKEGYLAVWRSRQKPSGSPTVSPPDRPDAPGTGRGPLP